MGPVYLRPSKTTFCIWTLIDFTILVCAMTQGMKPYKAHSKFNFVGVEHFQDLAQSLQNQRGGTWIFMVWVVKACKFVGIVPWTHRRLHIFERLQRGFSNWSFGCSSCCLTGSLLCSCYYFRANHELRANSSGDPLASSEVPPLHYLCHNNIHDQMVAHEYCTYQEFTNWCFSNYWVSYDHEWR